MTVAGGVEAGPAPWLQQYLQHQHQLAQAASVAAAAASAANNKFR